MVIEYMKAIIDESVLQKLDGGKFAAKEYQDYLLLEREEGREEGKAEILLSQFRKKFGHLPQAAEERIRSLTPGQLNALAESLFDIRSLDEIENFC
jgi:predicted Zn-dependent peptidase